MQGSTVRKSSSAACCVSQARPVPPPAAALHSVEPKPVSPALLLRPNNSVLSLTSLLGDCTELEGLGSSSRPLSMAGLSSRCGSGASELIQLNSRAGNVDTPPGGPAAFETSDRLRRCLAPQVAQGDPELGLGSSHPNLDPDPSPAYPTLTRTNACIRPTLTRANACGAAQMVRSCCSPCASSLSSSISSSATPSGVTPSGVTPGGACAPQAMRPHSSSSAGQLPPLVRQRSVGSSRRVPLARIVHPTATPPSHGTQPVLDLTRDPPYLALPCLVP